MPEPTAELQALRASTADLLTSLDALAWSDDDVRAASLCAGWTRGHVLTHLARNADGITATLAGALRGEIVPRYADGTRDADIEAGAGRLFAEQLDDLRDSTQRLDRVLGAVAEADAWGHRTADDHLAAQWVWQRLVEVEVHHVDLAAGYSPVRWPPLLVSGLLPRLADELAGHGGPAVRLEVVEDTSTVVPDLTGYRWTVGTGDTTIAAPDWALLAWLTGRADAARDVLGDVPELASWR